MNNRSYDDLVQLVQDGKITMTEFVKETEGGEYEDWCKARGVEECDKTAEEYLDYKEEKVFKNQ